MLFQKIQQNIQLFGIPKTIFDLSYRAVNTLTYARIFQGMSLTMDNLNPQFLTLPAQYRWQLLTPSEIAPVFNDPVYHISPDFLARAAYKNDHCLAIFHGNRLVSYGWYSTKPTRVSRDLIAVFSNNWAYMYRGFTHPDYRGQRLHAHGKALALKLYQQKGYKGLLSYAEINNYRSLRSNSRLGYQNFGKIYIVKVGKYYWIHAEKGCVQFGFAIIPSYHFQKGHLKYYTS